MNCVRPAWARTYGVQVPCGSTALDSSRAKDNHEPKARARPRGLVWRKPECKRCEATDRNRIQGRGLRGKLAHDSEAQRYAAYGKCGACAPTVRVLTWGDLHRERCVSMVVNPGWFTPGHQEPGAAASCPPRVEETAATTIEAGSATGGNAGRDGAEVSRRRSRWPGVGPLKGRTTRHKEQTLPTSNASPKPDRARCARRSARTEP